MTSVELNDFEEAVFTAVAELIETGAHITATTIRFKMLASLCEAAANEYKQNIFSMPASCDHSTSIAQTLAKLCDANLLKKTQNHEPCPYAVTDYGAWTLNSRNFCTPTSLDFDF